MKLRRNRWIILVLLVFLQSCFFYAAYGIYRTVSDINRALNMVEYSMNHISTVLDEGKEIKRAAEEGRLIGTLAEKIPTLIQDQVEKAAKEKIISLSGDLKLFSFDFVHHALAENLKGACMAYNRMADVYNQFSDLMSELSRSNPAAGKKQLQ